MSRAATAVCLLFCVAAIMSACGIPANASAETGSRSPATPSSGAPSDEWPRTINRNCTEDEPCAFAPGQYELGLNPESGVIMAGLGFTLAETWESRELWLAELNLNPPGIPDDTLRMWIDPPRTDAKGHPDPSFANTTQGIIASLTANPNLTVSPPEATSIGTLAGTAVAVQVSPGAQNVDGDCPPVGVPCAVMLGAGIGSPVRVRLYVADLESSEGPHTLVVALEGQDQQRLDALETRAATLIGSVTLPEPYLLTVWCRPDESAPAIRC
jgi:hypothetical protein